MNPDLVYKLIGLVIGLGIVAAVACAVVLFLRAVSRPASWVGVRRFLRVATLAPEREVWFAVGSRPTTEELLDLYRQLTYRQLADEMKAAFMPCWRLTPISSPDRPRASRLGGSPDLPDPQLWPTDGRRCLPFVAQIRLDEVSSGHCRGLLPERGMLYFFCDATQPHPDAGAAMRRVGAVVHCGELAGARPVSWPGEVLPRYEPVPLRLEPIHSVPHPAETPSWSVLRLSEQEEARGVYWQWRLANAPLHQFLGLPSMPVRENQLAAPPSRQDSAWILLLQVDSDTSANLARGLRFWITEQDLRRRCFDQVWVALESA